MEVPVIGEAFAERFEVMVDGTCASTSRLKVKVIDWSDMQLLFGQVFQRSGTQALGKIVLINVGRTDSETLPDALPPG